MNAARSAGSSIPSARARASGISAMPAFRMSSSMSGDHAGPPRVQRLQNHAMSGTLPQGFSRIPRRIIATSQGGVLISWSSSRISVRMNMVHAR